MPDEGVEVERSGEVAVVVEMMELLIKIARDVSARPVARATGATEILRDIRERAILFRGDKPLPDGR